MPVLKQIRWAPRFGLRTLFLVTTIVAVSLSVGGSAGVVGVGGALIALGMLLCAARWRPRGPIRFARLLLAVGGLGVLWMVAVDCSWFREVCGDCRLDTDIYQYRVLGIVVHERRREVSYEVSRVAADLGVPCTHRLSRCHMTRVWGLIWPAYPCFSGTVRLWDDDEWYDERMSQLVRVKARQSPGLGAEFRKRVVLEHDWAYWHHFLDELRQERNRGLPENDDGTANRQLCE